MEHNFSQALRLFGRILPWATNSSWAARTPLQPFLADKEQDDVTRPISLVSSPGLTLGCTIAIALVCGALVSRRALNYTATAHQQPPEQFKATDKEVKPEASVEHQKEQNEEVERDLRTPQQRHHEPLGQKNEADGRTTAEGASACGAQSDTNSDTLIRESSGSNSGLPTVAEVFTALQTQIIGARDLATDSVKGLHSVPDDFVYYPRPVPFDPTPYNFNGSGSAFHPAFPVPPHYQDHPRYLAMIEEKKAKKQDVQVRQSAYAGACGTDAVLAPGEFADLATGGTVELATPKAGERSVSLDTSQAAASVETTANVRANASVDVEKSISSDDSTTVHVGPSVAKHVSLESLGSPNSSGTPPSASTAASSVSSEFKSGSTSLTFSAMDSSPPEAAAAPPPIDTEVAQRLSSYPSSQTSSSDAVTRWTASSALAASKVNRLKVNTKSMMSPTDTAPQSTHETPLAVPAPASSEHRPQLIGRSMGLSSNKLNKFKDNAIVGWGKSFHKGKSLAHLAIPNRAKREGCEAKHNDATASSRPPVVSTDENPVAKESPVDASPTTVKSEPKTPLTRPVICSLPTSDAAAVMRRPVVELRSLSRRVPVNLDKIKANAKTGYQWSRDKVDVARTQLDTAIRHIDKAIEEGERERMMSLSAHQPRVIFPNGEIDNVRTQELNLFKSALFADMGTLQQSKKPELPPRTMSEMSLYGHLSPALSRPSVPASPNTLTYDHQLEFAAKNDSQLDLNYLPSPPFATYDPKSLWSPTTQSERLHSVNQALHSNNLDVDRTELGISSPQPPPLAQDPPQDSTDYTGFQLSQYDPSQCENMRNKHGYLPPVDYFNDAPPQDFYLMESIGCQPTQPQSYSQVGEYSTVRDMKAEQRSQADLAPSQGHLRSDSLHVKARHDSQSSHAISTPATHDTDMMDGATDLSTPLNTAYGHQTPQSNFTDSDMNPITPELRSTHEPHLQGRSNDIRNRPLFDGLDAGNPGYRLTDSLAVTPIGSPREYRCDECGKTFEQIHRLNHHKRYHERKHQCPVNDCGKKFGTKTHLDRHINDKHKKTRKFHCPEPSCPYSLLGGKSFPRKDNWVRHVRKKHRDLSLSHNDAQGFVIDEETGTTHPLPAVTSQQRGRHAVAMKMAFPTSYHSSPPMANGLNGSNSGAMNPLMTNVFNSYAPSNKIAMGVNNHGMSREMNTRPYADPRVVQQPQMISDLGFNSWPTNPQISY